MLKKMVALVLLFALADAQAISFNLFPFGNKKQTRQPQQETLEAEAEKQKEQKDGGCISNDGAAINQLAEAQAEVNSSEENPVNQLSADLKNEANVVEVKEEAAEVLAEEKIEQEMHKGIIPAGIVFIVLWLTSLKQA